MQILVVDVGGTHVKILATGQAAPREFVSGPSLTAEKMVSEVLKAVEDWDYDVVSIGYPGPVLRGKPIAEPHNLEPGWVGFNFETAFGCPVKLINDAAMQALGSYDGGTMLFLGLGTGLGSAMIVDGILEPMELGHLPYRKGTYEDYVGIRGLKRVGKRKWRRYVEDVVARLIAALEPDYVVLGGGNVHKLKVLPPSCRLGKTRMRSVEGFAYGRRPANGRLNQHPDPVRPETQQEVSMTVGFDPPLYILAFNQRESFSTKMFGWEGVLSAARRPSSSSEHDASHANQVTEAAVRKTEKHSLRA